MKGVPSAGVNKASPKAKDGIVIGPWEWDKAEGLWRVSAMVSTGQLFSMMPCA